MKLECDTALHASVDDRQRRSNEKDAAKAMLREEERKTIEEQWRVEVSKQDELDMVRIQVKR